MTLQNEDILDPAHVEDSGIENAGAVGLQRPGDDKPQPKISEDGNIVEIDGKKYITEQALAAERARASKYAETLSQLDPLMPEFEEFLAAKRGRADRPQARQTAASGDVDDEAYLTEVAEALGFYDAEQAPDLRRAQAHLNITRREAQRTSRREMEPLARTTQGELARVNKERARGVKFVDGQPIAEDKYLDAAFNAVDERMLADPGVSILTTVIAAGLQHLDMRKNGTLRPSRRSSADEPMFLEGGSGRFDTEDSALSGLDLAAARARGKSPEQWSKLVNKIGGSKTGAALEEI